MIDLARIRTFQAFEKMEEAELELIFNSVVAEFQRGTRRIWTYQKDYTEIHNIDIRGGPKISTLWFKLYPISSIVLIQWNFGETESNAETIDSGYYNMDSAKGKVIKDTFFNYPFVKATITGGYTNDQIWDDFPDIVEAITIEMRYRLKRDNEQNIIINSQGFEKGQTNLRKDLHHPKFTATMKAYRKL